MRIGTNLLNVEEVIHLTTNIYEPESRIDKQRQDQRISSVVKGINLFFNVLLLAYFLGMIWYRYSDYLLMLIMKGEPEERYWVV